MVTYVIGKAYDKNIYFSSSTEILKLSEAASAKIAEIQWAVGGPLVKPSADPPADVYGSG